MDMAIALLVVGVLSAKAIAEYHRYAEEKTYYNTVMGLNSVKTGIENYYLQHGNYPCPADPTLGPEDAAYGAALACATGGAVDDVINGMVPFKDLGIPMEYAIDGWGMKFEYAVTRGLTDPSTFEEDNGAIFIDGVSDDGVTAMPYAPAVGGGNKAHYIVLSHGENMVGAYAPSGAEGLACTTASSMEREEENCNRDDRYFNQLFARSLSSGATYLDDMLVYSVSIPSRIWVPSEDGTDVISDNLKFGIGTNNPQYDLDVVGNIRADNGDVAVSQACEDDPNAYNCFNPSMIGGNGVSCAGNHSAATGFAYGDIVCDPTYISSGFDDECPDGEYVVGFSAGGVQCAAPPP